MFWTDNISLSDPTFMFGDELLRSVPERSLWTRWVYTTKRLQSNTMSPEGYKAGNFTKGKTAKASLSFLS